MFVKEILEVESCKKPKASTFDNNYKYGEMLVEKTLSFTLLASIIYYQLWEEHMLLISLMEG
jgi:GTP cyclohydrolase I